MSKLVLDLLVRNERKIDAANLAFLIRCAMNNPKNAELVKQISTKHRSEFSDMMKKLKNHADDDFVSDLMSGLEMSDTQVNKRNSFGGRGQPVRGSRVLDLRPGVLHAVTSPQVQPFDPRPATGPPVISETGSSSGLGYGQLLGDATMAVQNRHGEFANGGRDLLPTDNDWFN